MRMQSGVEFGLRILNSRSVLITEQTLLVLIIGFCAIFISLFFLSIRIPQFEIRNHLITLSARRPSSDSAESFRPNLLGCFQIDDELELRRLLHRQVGGLGAFQNLVHDT